MTVLYSLLFSLTDTFLSLITPESRCVLIINDQAINGNLIYSQWS